MPEFRDTPTPGDLPVIRRILESSGFFAQAPDEIPSALRLVAAALAQGNSAESARVILAEEAGAVAGYICYSRVPCSLATYEIRWLAVDDALRGRGVGRRMLERALAEIRERGGAKVVLATAGRELYRPTHRFYAGMGFVPEARIKDYYAPGDDGVFYTLELTERASAVRADADKGE